MDPFDFQENDENDNLVWQPKKRHNFKTPVEGSFVSLVHEIIVGEKFNCKFLKCENHLYTATDYSVYGRRYRCKNRKCPARLTLLSNDNCIRFNTDKLHSHEENSEELIKSLAALNDIKKKCSDLQTVAQGRRLAKVKDIYTEVMIG